MIRLGLALAGALLFAMSSTHTSAVGSCVVSDLTVDAQESQFMTLLNQYRAGRGLRPLSMAPSLNRSATWMATDEVAHGYFSHTDSIGRDPFTRMRDCGYTAPGGENLARGYLPTAAAVLAAWQSSPGHNAAMLQPGFTQMGIAHVGQHWALTFGYGNEGVGPVPVKERWSLTVPMVAHDQ